MNELLEIAVPIVLPIICALALAIGGVMIAAVAVQVWAPC